MIDRLLIGLLGILLSTATAAGEPDPGRGLGGTGLSADQSGSGIGGTGFQPSGDGRGIGGTGIVGTIRAFGSIWVNGVEVHYWEDQAVTIYDRQGTPKDLRVGQVVAVEAEPQAGRLVARSIEVRHAVVGPIASIDGRAGTMQVLGQRVRLPQGDPLNGTLRPGDWVSVSGLRDPKGVVVASHLDLPPEDTDAFVRGDLEQVDSRGLIIGGRRYPLPPGADPSAIHLGGDLMLYGEPDGDTLRGTRLRQGWDLPFDGRVRNFLVEGFIGTNGRRVGALTLPDTAYRPKTGERVVVQGRFGVDGKLEPDSLRVLSAPSGLDRLRLRLDDLDRDRGAGRPSSRQGTQERAGPWEQRRSNAPNRDRPVGVAPRLEPPGYRGADGGDQPSWRQHHWPAPAPQLGPGWMGGDPMDPDYPGLSSGFQGPATLGGSGISGGTGAASGMSGGSVPGGRGGR